MVSAAIPRGLGGSDSSGSTGWGPLVDHPDDAGRPSGQRPSMPVVVGNSLRLIEDGLVARGLAGGADSSEALDVAVSDVLSFSESQPASVPASVPTSGAPSPNTTDFGPAPAAAPPVAKAGALVSAAASSAAVAAVGRVGSAVEEEEDQHEDEEEEEELEGDEEEEEDNQEVVQVRPGPGGASAMRCVVVPARGTHSSAEVVQEFSDSEGSDSSVSSPQIRPPIASE